MRFDGFPGAKTIVWITSGAPNRPNYPHGCKDFPISIRREATLRASARDVCRPFEVRGLHALPPALYDDARADQHGHGYRRRPAHRSDALNRARNIVRYVASTCEFEWRYVCRRIEHRQGDHRRRSRTHAGDIRSRLRARPPTENIASSRCRAHARESAWMRQRDIGRRNPES